MSTPRAALTWFRAWGRAALFGAAAAAAALSLSAYTARTRTLAMRQIYFNAWHVLPGFTVFMTLLSWVVIQITISLARDYGLAQFALELVKTVNPGRSEEHTSELQSHVNLVCRLLLEKKKSKE